VNVIKRRRPGAGVPGAGPVERRSKYEKSPAAAGL